MSNNGGRPAYDPGAALRALAEAPRVGFETAAAVIERLLALGRPDSPVAAVTWNGQGANGDAPPADRRIQLRRARADAERVLDAYGDWARQLLDGVFALADPGQAPEVLVLGPARAGAVATADLWLHAPTGRLTASCRLHATPLTAHDGSMVPADAVGFEPASLVPAPAGGPPAPATTVRLTVPPGTRPGTYHGHVLVDGLPEVALALQAEVLT